MKKSTYTKPTVIVCPLEPSSPVCYSPLVYGHGEDPNYDSDNDEINTESASYRSTLWGL